MTSFASFFVITLGFNSVISENLALPPVMSLSSMKHGTIAYGLNVLRLQARFRLSEVSSCRWRGLEKCQYGVSTFFNRVNPCYTSPNCRSYFNCTYIKSNETILIEFKFENITESFVITIACESVVKISWNGSVKNCSASPPLLVHSKTSIFNSSGSFYCNNGGTLVYSNGTELASAQTTCVANAEWYGKNDVQCWTAPSNIRLIGNTTAVTGENLNFTCAYDTLIPFGKGSILFIESIGNLTSKNHHHVIMNVNKNYHSKKIYCQALTPYTRKINKTAGRSVERKLNIMYLPEFLPAKCTWMVNTPGSCNVTVTSNPLTSFVSLRKNGSEISITMNSSNEFYYQVVKLSNTSQVYVFNKKQAFDNDSGIYTITTSIKKLNAFASTTFAVIRNDSQNASTSAQNLSEIIAWTVASVLLALAILILTIYCIKRKGTQKSNAELKHIYINTIKSENSSNVKVSDDIVYEVPESGCTEVKSSPDRKQSYITLTNCENQADINFDDEAVYEVPDSGENTEKSDAAVKHAYINSIKPGE